LAHASHSEASPWADAVLGIFAKRPVPGAVKTRLAEATSPEWAARVAAAFLCDTLDRFCDFPGRRLVAYSPAADSRFFSELTAGRYETTPQAEGDLGHRLEAFFRAFMADGTRRIVSIGTDSPTLPVPYVSESFERLRHADVVIGPATDGGYYLLGCAHRVPPIFQGITWGSANVLSETIARLARLSIRLDVLPPWYDVDTLADWHALRGHIAALKLSGAEPCATATERLIASAGPTGSSPQLSASPAE
jgi:uncharacterized protein